MTLSAQVGKLRESFGLREVVVVGDRGLINSKRIEEDIKPAGFGWITALTSASISSLMAEGGFQPSLFDECDMAQMTSDKYPGERLVVCRNFFLTRRRRITGRNCCAPRKTSPTRWLRQ